jgi:hypothetical protein
MLRRTLILSLCLTAAIAVVGVTAASAKFSDKFTFTLPPIPGITQDPIDMACQAAIDNSDGKTLKFDCHNSGKLGATNAVNPHPPKDRKVFKINEDGVREALTLYPDGQVTLIGYGGL